MALKLTRQFSTSEPALRRDLFRLCEELERGTKTLEQQLESTVALLTAAMAALEADVAAQIAAIPTYTPSQCLVRQTNVSVTTTEAAIAFSAADLIDTDGYHDPSSDNTRFTILEDGHYEVHAMALDSTPSENSELRLRRGGSVYLAVAQSTDGINDFGGPLFWSGALTAGQYLELMVDTTFSHTLDSVVFLIRRLDP